MGMGRSLYFSGASAIVRFAIQFALSIFVARVLTPEEIGSFGVALAAAALIRAFESAGVNNFVASYKDLTQPLLRTVFTVNMLLNLFLAGSLWLIAKPIGHFFDSSAVTSIVELTAFAVALNTHLPIIYGTLRRAMRFKALMGFDLLLTVVSSVVTIVGVLEGYGALSLAFAIIAEKVASILIGVLFFSRSIPMWPRIQQSGVILKYGIPLSLATVIGIMGVHANNFILGRLLGLAPSAQFDRALTLPRLIWQVAVPSFQNVLVPEISRQHREGEAYQATLLKTVQTYTMMSWPLGLVLVFLSPKIVLVLFGQQWQEAAMLTPYLLLYGLLLSPITLAASVFVSFGHGKELVNIQLSENGCKIILLLLVPFYGLYALAILMVLPLVVNFLVTQHYLTRITGISLWDFLLMLSRPFVTSLVSAIPASVVFFLNEVSIFDMAVLVSLSATVYVACLWLRDRWLLEHIVSMLGFDKTFPVNDKRK